MPSVTGTSLIGGQMKFVVSTHAGKFVLKDLNTGLLVLIVNTAEELPVALAELDAARNGAITQSLARHCLGEAEASYLLLSFEDGDNSPQDHIVLFSHVVRSPLPKFLQTVFQIAVSNSIEKVTFPLSLLKTRTLDEMYWAIMLGQYVDSHPAREFPKTIELYCAGRAIGAVYAGLSVDLNNRN
jgi:hypothetical protein